MNKQNSITSSIFYKSLERYSTMAFQMVVQIVIARILTPADFGIVAMMSVFINIAGIFIYNGFNMAVIQKKEADNRDFSTALFVNSFIGIFLYALIFFCSPAIARYYEEPDLMLSLRILALILPLGSVFSIQSAIASRHMRYDILFFCNLSGSVISGILGIISALCGMGFWALIVQQISNIVIATILLLFKTQWKPQLTFVWQSAKDLFAFGWKLFAAGLLNSIYNELNSLVIGKKYTSSDLAFYTKGKTFPSAVSSGLDSALQSVMLSAFSRKQDDYKAINGLMRKSMLSNTYVITPIMVLLAICAQPFTVILLTEKWLPMVPYMQICCFTFVLHPIGTINMQALAAIGKSDVRLKLEFIKKPIGLLLLFASMRYGPMAIALSAALIIIIGFIIGFIACQIYLKYPVMEFFKEVMPSWTLSTFVGLIAFYIMVLGLHPLLTLLLQTIIFVTFYVLLSHLFKLEGYHIVKNHALQIFKSRKK